MRSIFRDRASASRIGRAYLSAHPQEADLARLLELTLAGTPAPPDRWALARLVAAKRQEDFVAGRLTWVEGRILSITEARACAVAALA